MDLQKKSYQDSFFQVFSESTKNSKGDVLNQLKLHNIININGKTFDYSRKDPIFNQTCRTEDKIPLSNCPSCDTKFKKERHKKYCHFCAKSYCKACLWKTKPFLRKEPKQKGQEVARGAICIVCDRKFMFRDIQKFYEDKIKRREETIKGMQNQLQDKENKYMDQLNHIKQIKEETKQIDAEFIEEQQDYQIKIDITRGEIEKLTKENNELTDRLGTKQQELRVQDKALHKMQVQTIKIESKNNKDHQYAELLKEEMKKLKQLIRQERGRQPSSQKFGKKGRSYISNSEDLDPDQTIVSYEKAQGDVNPFIDDSEDDSRVQKRQKRRRRRDNETGVCRVCTPGACTIF